VKLINFSRRYKDTFGTSADQERIASLEKHMMQMWIPWFLRANISKFQKILNEKKSYLRRGRRKSRKGDRGNRGGSAHLSAISRIRARVAQDK
jgi:hypothetical protein